MPIISVEALSYRIDDGRVKREFYMGALAVRQLEQIAEVPSFDEDTEQHVIAGNLLAPPVEDWQRPRNAAKVDAIQRRFDQVGEFMPNPILLAVHDKDAVKVTPHQVNGSATGMHVIEIETGSDDKPLWILDGQHRVKGLSQSSRAENPIPFVLLHSEIGGTYVPQDFAKVFAEVSTAATPLNELHREWLQYAFDLDKYDTNAPGAPGQNAQFHKLAMETVAILCGTQTFPGGAGNAYFNKIQFNPERPPSPVHHKGFIFPAPLLQDLVYAEYYNLAQAGTKYLNPMELAETISKATLALVNSVATPVERTVFFGDGAKRSQYIEQAFIAGVLRKIKKDPATNWPHLLGVLRFPNTNWEFTWVRSTGGADGTVSKKIARNVFVEAFELAAIPYGSNDLVSYLRGDKAAVEFEASFLTPSHQPQRGDKATTALNVEGINVFETGGRPHVRLRPKFNHTANIGKLDIYDPDQPRGRTYTTQSLKSGVVLDESKELKIRVETYGGLEKELQLTINPS
jgi:DGQHR domain-containing protein